MTPTQAIKAVQPVMQALRARTGRNYACAVSAGRFQLQIIAYEKRRTVVTPVTEWTSLESFVAAASNQR